MDTDRSQTTDHRPRRRSRLGAAGLLLVALAAVAILATACRGSSAGAGLASIGSTTPTTTASGNASTGSTKSGGLLAYSQCMRAHGLPDFPDPNSQGAIVIHQSSASGGNAKEFNPNSPTYQAAQKACQKYASGGTTPADQAQQLKQALKYSACMRSHKVTTFPDPTVVNGQISFSGSGIGRSPHYQSANAACQSLLSNGSGS
jgi:hypothetical protein